MEIDNETIPSPPSVVQRETTIILVDPVVPVDPIAPIDIPRDIALGHRRLASARQTLQEAEGHATPQGTSRESKRPKRFSSCFSAMSHIIDSEPSCQREVTGQQVWQDAMAEEY
jgi:hypothetical protein